MHLIRSSSSHCHYKLERFCLRRDRGITRTVHQWSGLRLRRALPQTVTANLHKITSSFRRLKNSVLCDKKLLAVYSFSLPAWCLVFAMENKKEVEPGVFNGYTTALEVLDGQDLTGRVAIVTGANTGIGFETARALVLHGCTVVFACRNLETAEAAVAKIRSEKPKAACHIMQLDLQSLDNVRKFAREFRESYDSLDMLILNAGVLGQSFSLTPDGYESTFQVNHLSQFYLTILLEPQLSSDNRNDSRVVIVSSESHRRTSLSEKDITEKSLSPEFSAWRGGLNAYRVSKLCNVLAASELARRWKDKNITVFSLHPGSLINTDLGRQWWVYRLAFALVRPFTKSLEQGASTSVYCATSLPSRYSGSYVKDCQLSPPSKSSQDEGVASLLWDISFKMVTAVVGLDAFTQKK